MLKKKNNSVFKTDNKNVSDTKKLDNLSKKEDKKKPENKWV